MGVRQKFDRKMREKEAEINELDLRLREARAYLLALQDATKLLPRDGEIESDETLSAYTVKPGTVLEAVVNALRKRGKPMHIMELLPAIGKEATSENRASVGSSISAYVRKGQVFARPAPNTFALSEWAIAEPQLGKDIPPDDFGLNS